MSEGSVLTLLETLLGKLSIEVEKIEISNNGIHTTYQIHTKDAALLIGTGGETLEALSYVTRRLAQKTIPEGEQKMFIVDVNNYQSKKLEEFIAGLQISANRVRTFKEPVELTTMSSYERMIVHSTFAEDKEITTQSEGEGKFRHIVLTYKTPSVDDGV